MKNTLRCARPLLPRHLAPRGCETFADARDSRVLFELRDCKPHTRVSVNGFRAGEPFFSASPRTPSWSVLPPVFPLSQPSNIHTESARSSVSGCEYEATRLVLFPRATRHLAPLPGARGAERLGAVNPSAPTGTFLSFFSPAVPLALRSVRTTILRDTCAGDGVGVVAARLVSFESRRHIEPIVHHGSLAHAQWRGPLARWSHESQVRRHLWPRSFRNAQGTHRRILFPSHR